MIAAGSVTHEQMLRGHELQLPLLGTSVDLVRFFWLAPALFVIVHGNVLLNLYLVARRARRFNALASLLPEAQEEHERALVAAFPFVEWRAGRQPSQTMQALLALVSWIVYIVLPLFGLLWVQFKWLPCQDILGTGFHLGLVLLDLLLLWIVWPRLGEAGRWWPAIRALAHQSASAVMLGSAVVATVAVPLVSLALWLDQQPDEIPIVGQLNGLALWGPYSWSRLEVRDRFLMQREPPASALAGATTSATNEEEKQRALEALYLEPTVATPIDLRGRRLRRADLRGARLYGARLEKADLEGALLTDAKLPGADLSGANLRGADLSRASLVVANLSKTKLQGARLADALLWGAELVFAELQVADLSRAQLYRAGLERAHLEGAFLSHAATPRLRGALLEGAFLTGTRLRGADLRGVALYGAQTSESTDLSVADLRGAHLRPSPVAIAEKVHDALVRLRAPTIDWTIVMNDFTEYFDAEPNDNFLLADNPEQVDPEMRALLGEGISPTEYEPKLAETLAALVCRSQDRWITAGVVRHRMRGDHQRDRPFVPDLAHRLLRDCPDLVSELDADDRAFVEKQADRFGARPSEAAGASN